MSFEAQSSGEQFRERLNQIEAKIDEVLEIRKRLQGSSIFGVNLLSQLDKQIFDYISVSLVNVEGSSFVLNKLNSRKAVLLYPNFDEKNFKTVMAKLETARRAYQGLLEGEFNDSLRLIARKIVADWKERAETEEAEEIRENAQQRLDEAVDTFNSVSLELGKTD